MFCAEQGGTGLPLLPVPGQGLAVAVRSAPSPAMAQALTPALVRAAASHGSAPEGSAPQSWLPQHPKTHCPCHAASGSECWEPSSCSLLIPGAALASEESGSKAAMSVPPRGQQSGPGVLPGSPCLFICSCVSRGRGEAQAERSSTGEKEAVSGPRSGSDRRRAMRPAPAHAVSCAGLNHGPRDGKKRQHRATSALLWLPEHPFLPQPCV